MGIRPKTAMAVFLQLIIGTTVTSESAFAQEQSKPVKVVEGTETSVRMDILSLTRDEGGMLTLRVAFENNSGGQVKNSVLPGKGNVENFALLDYGNRRKYLVVRDSGGGCLCTSLNPFGATDPGKHVLWAKFASPPTSVDHLTLLMPEAEPVDGVPIAH